jgi:PTS system nitrogen regulatory IIA component
MSIFDFLKKETCEIALKSKTKETVLLELSQLLKRSPVLKHIDLEIIHNALEEREKIGTTGFGEGIAIPHCKLEQVDDFVVGIGISKKGIDFKALDNKKVNIFFVTIGPLNKPDVHVKMLARISRILKNKKACMELIKAPSRTALYETFLRHTRSDNIMRKEWKKQKLLMLVIKDEQYYDDILEFFIEIGIKGATAIESKDMSRLLSDVPLFADFLNFLGKRNEYTKTIFTVIHEDEISMILEGIEEITGDLDSHTGAMVMVLDLFMVKGSLEE